LAHLEAHGGFQQYRAAKAKLFEALGKSKKKSFFSKKIKGLNLDDLELKYFLQFPADQSFGISISPEAVVGVDKIYCGRKESDGLEIQGQHLKLQLPGEFNLQNALMAIACANMLGVDIAVAVKSLDNFSAVAGRMEEIKNNLGFKIFVDYAPEPTGMKSALEALQAIPHQKIIHVFGSTGGHRDVAKRFEFGKISAQFADHIIITNDDVYDSNPEEIATNIIEGIRGQAIGKSYETILDRRAAIHRALEVAQPDDIIIITGKGSEQFLVLPGNKRIEWDDREVVREELNKILELIKIK
jgi:UDP-N-acetylmuramoyl-L-alanyl-D-glutamate--2,6-diaminopimelate ligase